MKNKPDLSVDFCGFKCENPFLLAASPVSRQGDMIGRAFEMGWGGAITKSVSLDQDLPDRSLSPRFVGINRGGSNLNLRNNIMGMANIDFRIDKSLKDTLDDFARLKRKYPQKFLAVSIKAEYDKGQWLKLASMAADTMPNAIELCLSCPDAACGDSNCDLGSIGQNPDAVKEVIGWIKEVTDLPVIIKLNANVSNIVSIALAAQKAGASAISTINAVRGIAGFNLETLNPLPTVDGMSTPAGLSGSLIKPFAMHVVYELGKSKNMFHLPVSGVGGVTCAQDAIEYMLLGASTVQVATQVMHEGYQVINDFIEGTLRFMEDQGFKTVGEFIGSSIPSFTTSTQALSRTQQMKSNIDKDKCIGCGRCYVSCSDGAYQAISFSADRITEVDKDKCVGCGLCKIVCPVSGAIYFTADDKRMEGLF